MSEWTADSAVKFSLQLEPPLPGDWTQLFADDLFEFALQLPRNEQESNRCWHQNSWEVRSRDG